MRDQTQAFSQGKRLSFEPLEDRRMLANITVTTLLDSPNIGNGDGLVSLREAVYAANNNVSVDGSVAGDSGHDQVYFDPNLNGTLFLNGGPIDINESMRIEGNDETTTIIDAVFNSRIFTISSFDQDVQLYEMTLRNGRAPGNNGGAIFAGDHINLSMMDVVLTNNSADAGGAIAIDGRLYMQNSQLNLNDATNGPGGAILVEYGSVEIRFSTLSNNTSFDNGGAIQSDQGVEVANSTFEDNSTTRFGGAINSYGTVDLQESVFERNTANLAGGALRIWHSGDSSITDSEFRNNESENSVGGAISSTHPNGSLWIEKSTISGNTAAANGGGLHGLGYMRIDYSTFAFNRAGLDGGGIYGDDVRIERSMINNNTADHSGGGLVHLYNSAFITNSTFSRNRASGDHPLSGGGAIYSYDARLDVRHVTIYQNTAVRNGGGIHFGSDSPLELRSSIVADNASILEDSRDIYAPHPSQPSNFRYNFIGHNEGAGVSEAYPNPDSNGNFVGGPNHGEINPALAARADNGGPTETHRVSLASPVVDQGEPGFIPLRDQRNLGRVRDGNEDGIERMEIGAYEIQGDQAYAITVAASLAVQNIVINPQDMGQYDARTDRWSLLFDGSDVGLDRVHIDAIHFEHDGTFLLSLDRAVDLAGLGTVREFDVLRFLPTSLGDDTEGTFELYLDGASLGLGEEVGNIDALGRNDEGEVILSISGDQFVTGIGDVSDEDLLVVSNGPADMILQMYLDGSDVQLDGPTEDVNGIWMEPDTGVIFLTTEGPFSTRQVSGDSNTVFGFLPSQLGPSTAGRFLPFIDGLPGVQEGVASVQVLTNTLAQSAISSHVFEDVNRNGIRDLGEPGVADVEVTLFDEAGNLISQTTTNADGVFLFNGPPPNVYVLQFDRPAGMDWTAANQGAIESRDSDVLADGRTEAFDNIDSAIVDWMSAGVVRRDPTRLPGAAIPVRADHGDGIGLRRVDGDDADRHRADGHRIIDLIWKESAI